MAEALVERGFDLVSGGTDNHLILIDLTSKDVLGKPAAKALDRAGLTANYNAVPFDPRKPFNPSGLRMGTPAVTSRGMGPDEMRLIAGWMDRTLAALGAEDEAAIDQVAAEVREVAHAFPAPGVPVA